MNSQERIKDPEKMTTIEKLKKTLGVSHRIAYTLEFNGITSLAKLQRVSDSYLLHSPKFGRESLKQLYAALADKKLSRFK